jgi:hypothetical protein
MRLILGMILGAALTVGGAYISDQTSSRSPEARPMVNWDVVSKNVDGWTEFVRESWKKLVG